MEAVEELMVGEEAYLQVGVREALVKRAAYGREGPVVAPVLEDGPDAIGLLRLVAEYL